MQFLAVWRGWPLGPSASLSAYSHCPPVWILGVACCCLQIVERVHSLAESWHHGRCQAIWLCSSKTAGPHHRSPDWNKNAVVLLTQFIILNLENLTGTEVEVNLEHFLFGYIQIFRRIGKCLWTFFMCYTFSIHCTIGKQQAGMLQQNNTRIASFINPWKGKLGWLPFKVFLTVLLFFRTSVQYSLKK